MVTEIDGPQMCPRTTIIVAVTLQGVMVQKQPFDRGGGGASEVETGVVIVAADTSWRERPSLEVEVGETTVETVCEIR